MLPSKRVQQVSMGYGHGGVLTTDGEFWLWGDNQNGQLGTGFTSKYRCTPMCLTTVVGGSICRKDFVFIGLGHAHTGGLTAATTNNAWLWGSNRHGQLGIPIVNTYPTPCNATPTQLILSVQFVSLYLGHDHTGGITSLGDLYMWGYNDEGQVGIPNIIENVQHPTQIVINGGMPEFLLTLGADHTGTVTVDQELFTFGDNVQNQLGLNNCTRSSPKLPTQVTSIYCRGNITYRQLAFGGEHSLALVLCTFPRAPPLTTTITPTLTPSATPTGTNTNTGTSTATQTATTTSTNTITNSRTPTATATPTATTTPTPTSSPTPTPTPTPTATSTGTQTSTSTGTTTSTTTGTRTYSFTRTIYIRPPTLTSTTTRTRTQTLTMTSTMTSTMSTTYSMTPTYLCCPPGTFNNGFDCVPIPPCPSPSPRPCPTDWSSWSACSVTCDFGFRSRSRLDENCQYQTVTEQCYMGPCVVPVDCIVSNWQDWSACSGSCSGVSQRVRYIIQQPSGGGLPCPCTLETRACGSPGVCTVGDWCSWGPCSVTAGNGIQTRTRPILNPGCPGSICPPTIETQPCCIQQCVFGDWSAWSDCSTCCGCGVQTRTRALLSGDQTCQPLVETQSCSGCAPPVVASLVLWNVLPTISATNTLDCLSLIVTFQAGIDASPKNYFAIRASVNIFIASSPRPISFDVTGGLSTCRLTRHSASSANFLMLQLAADCVVRAGTTWTMVIPTEILARTPAPVSTVYVSVIATSNTATTGANTNTFTPSDMTPFALAVLASTAGTDAAQRSQLASYARTTPAVQSNVAQLPADRTAEEANTAMLKVASEAAGSLFNSVLAAEAEIMPAESSSGTPLVLLSLLAIPVVLVAVLAAFWWKSRRNLEMFEIEAPEPELEAMPPKKSMPGTPLEIAVPVAMPESPKGTHSPSSAPSSLEDHTSPAGSALSKGQWY